MKFGASGVDKCIVILVILAAGAIGWALLLQRATFLVLHQYTINHCFHVCNLTAGILQLIVLEIELNYLMCWLMGIAVAAERQQHPMS